MDNLKRKINKNKKRKNKKKVKRSKKPTSKLSKKEAQVKIQNNKTMNKNKIKIYEVICISIHLFYFNNKIEF